MVIINIAVSKKRKYHSQLKWRQVGELTNCLMVHRKGGADSELKIVLGQVQFMHACLQSSFPILMSSEHNGAFLTNQEKHSLTCFKTK